MIKLSFHGAARMVPGSKYLITVNDRKILIDCGLFQGARELRQLNWESPPFDPAELDAIVLTHGHIDHIGYLPRLVKQGYKGPIFATPPTVDISTISLLDTAHLQMEDAEYRNRNKLSRHPKALPLFDTDDAQAAINCLKPIEFSRWVEVGKGFRFRYHRAGHILGAAGVEVELLDAGRKVNIFFSGDVGRYGNPLTINPSAPPETDYLVCESTYGGRIHPPEEPSYELAKIINDIHRTNTVLLIPAFAVGRTQQIVYMINHLIRHKVIPPIDIHIDSPMAISATDIYVKYRSYHSLTEEELKSDQCLLNGRNVFFHRERSESKALNRLKGPAVIISASGMMTGGRILHHLLNRLNHPETVLLLVGFMAEGTIGRKIMDGEKEVYIHKTLVAVLAQVISIQSLSGHADFFELLHWLEPIKKGPRTVFVTHGELSQSEAMAGHIKDERGWNCMIPTLGQSVEL
ncbi:Metallo-beta-lactamase family protein [Candidatus Zixiibacteriota bacterium]|nr:Metallo-beta-lactamase family protein [candidate division Zixibacteria bacterium]